MPEMPLPRVHSCLQNKPPGDYEVVLSQQWVHDPSCPSLVSTPQPISLEATCGGCGETFVPADENDLEHGEREDGTPCGSRGEITRAYYGPLSDTQIQMLKEAADG